MLILYAYVSNADKFLDIIDTYLIPNINFVRVKYALRPLNILIGILLRAVPSLAFARL